MNTLNAFYFKPMTEADAREVCSWRYPPPYDRYDWPDWSEMAAGGREFADESIRRTQYGSFCSREGELCGYVQWFPLDRAVRLGLGLRPDLCGAGLGDELLRQAVREAGSRYPGAEEIDLEVETWNARAIRAYEKAGFRITDEYDKETASGAVPVYCMVWQPRPQPRQPLP